MTHPSADKYGKKEEREHALHNVLEGVRLSLLEVVSAVDGVEPDIEEVVGPVAAADEEAGNAEPVAVLRDDEVDARALEVGKCLDDAVGRHDGLVGQHARLEPRRRRYVSTHGHGVVHDQRVAVQRPKPRRARERRHGVSQRRHLGPRPRRSRQAVRCVVREEGGIA